MSLFGRIIRFVKSEPAILTTAATVGCAYAADFGFHLSSAQQSDVFAAASAVSALIIRQAVTPNGKVPSPTAADAAAAMEAANGLSLRIAAVEAAITELATPSSTTG